MNFKDFDNNLLISTLIPLLISTAISFITLIVNSVLQLYAEKNKLKLLQHNELLEFYPKLKRILVEISIEYNVLKKNKFYKKLKIKSLKKEYLDYTKLQNKINPSNDSMSEFNNFQHNLDVLIKSYCELLEFFNENNMPIYNRKFIKMKNKIQYACFYLENSIEDKNYYKIVSHLKGNKIKKLERKLDKIYNKS